MKRGLSSVLFLTALLILISYSYAETETPLGIFNITNVPPPTPGNWSPTTTHDKSQTFIWDEGQDDNGDPISTYVCITNDTDVDSCSVVNTFTATPSYTFTQAEPNWDYAWGTTFRWYFVKLTPNDGTTNGTANDTISFTLYDYLPVITYANSTSPNKGDKDIGENVTFTANFTDSDAVDNHSMRVCKSDAISTSGTCTGGEWCNVTPYQNATNFSCNEYLDSTEEPNTNYTAFFFICDCPPNDLTCPGQCSVSANVTFWVNHPPYIVGVPDIKPDSPNSTNDLNCTYVFNDTDSDAEGSTTFKWFKDYVLQPGLTTQVIGAGNTSPGEVWQCEVTPVDEWGLAGTPVNSTTEIIAVRAPTFTVPTDDNSTYAYPTNEGSNVTFTANASDPDTQNYVLWVCYTNNITGAHCEAGQTTCNSSWTVSGAQATCSHNTSGEGAQNYSWYSFACDTDNNCSTAEFTNSPYHVNHRPNATNVDIIPDSPNTNDNLTCNYTFNDDPGDTDNSTFKWFNWSGTAWQDVGVNANILNSTYTRVNETWMCEVTPIDGHGFAGIPVNSTNETITNVPPNQPTGFMVQDSPTTWDSTPPIDTHDKDPNINWSVTDDDGDPVTTYVCVSSNTSNRDAAICDVNYTATINSYINNLSGLEYNGASIEYYFRLTPFDGLENGTYLDVNLTLLNGIPYTPSNLYPTETHNQTPELSWANGDPDDGTVDHWPADNVTMHIRIGDVCGQGTYHSNDNANNNSEISGTIPWGTPGPEWANRTVCVVIWTNDSHPGGVSQNYTENLTLYDFLPDIIDVEMVDIGPYSSCIISTCALNPVEHSNTTAAVRVTTNDTDNDCDLVDANGEVWIYLCLNTTTCNESMGDYYWEVDNVVRAGSICTYTFTANKTASDGTPEFFRPPNSTYKLWVNATDQAGRRTADNERLADWTYGTLTAVDYPSVVTLGNGTPTLGRWNNGTVLAVMTNWGNNILDLQWNSSNPKSSNDEWQLNGTDFQIDDDPAYADESTGYLAPVYMNATLKYFDPDTGLERCSAFACDDPNLNETLDTYFHIAPPLGLLAGSYNSTITIVLSTHS